MKTISRFLNPFRKTVGRNDRYYQGVIGQGSGYPTFDEARKDLLMRDAAIAPRTGWR